MELVCETWEPELPDRLLQRASYLLTKKGPYYIYEAENNNPNSGPTPIFWQQYHNRQRPGLLIERVWNRQLRPEGQLSRKVIS